jgi:fructose-specific phosphotransferase system IIC component
MIVVQLVSTAVMLVLAVVLAPYGTVWVAAAWGIGHVVGGVLGYLVTATVARFPDDAPIVEEELVAP